MMSSNSVFLLHLIYNELRTKNPQVYLCLLIIHFLFNERVLSPVRGFNEMLIFATNQLET